MPGLVKEKAKQIKRSAIARQPHRNGTATWEATGKYSDLPVKVTRRTIATRGQSKGTVKDVQGMVRHSRVATTTDVYMQELPEGARATVDSIHHDLKGKVKKLASKASIRAPAAATRAAMVS